jgi:hypothetical protein
MSHAKENVARAWLDDTRPTARVANYRAESIRLPDDALTTALVSYGPHYVVGYRDGSGGVWVNQNDFEGEDYHAARLAAGWSSGIKGDSNGSPWGRIHRTTRASPTTRAHVSALVSVLSDRGYSPIGNRTQGGPNGHTYQLWTP